MHRAIELSKNSVKTGGGPFGAVIAKDGIIIADHRHRRSRSSFLDVGILSFRNVYQILRSYPRRSFP